MNKTITVKNVSIGDRFLFNGKKNLLSEVVDILELHSMATGEVVGHTVIAKGVNTIATNTFDVSFTTVVRWRVNA